MRRDGTSDEEEDVRHYATTEEAKADFPVSSFHSFIDNTLIVRVDDDWSVYLLLRENEGLYWCEADER